MAKSDDADAQLLATIDLKPPASARASFVAAASGRMRIALWRGGGRRRGTVLLVHGLGECIEKHFPTIDELLGRGFAAVAFDLAGHGLSSDPPPERLRDFSAYDENLDAAIAHLRARRLPRPWLGLGHSLGGALLLAAAARQPKAFAGILLAAPMLGIRAFEAMPFTESLTAMLPAGAASAFLHFPKFVPHNHTSDLQARTHCRALLLAHPRLAPRVPAVPWCQGAIGYMKELCAPARLEKISLPVTIALAEDEVLISNRQARSVAAALPGANLVEIAEAQHELLLERPELRARLWEHIDTSLLSPAGRDNAAC